MFRILSLLALFLPVVLSPLGCKNSEEAPAAHQVTPPPLPIKYIVAQHQRVPIWIEYTGRTEATKRVSVKARVQGRLDEVLFNEGDIVEKGQKLFVLEKDSYQAEVERTRAVLQKDRASLALAIADVKRYEPLVADGLAPRATLEQYIARKGELEASIKADKAAIKEAELNLSYTEVLAPISGRISRKNVDVGNIVGYGENTELTTIVADDPIYSYFNPTEEELQTMRSLRDKDKMEARIRVPDSMVSVLKRPEFSGYVDFTDNRVDPRTGTVSMRALISNPDHLLLEGTFVYTEVFLTREKSFIVLPPQVVFDDQRGSYVYAIDEENKIYRVNISRGHATRYFLVVRDGLKDGTKVVINGLAKLRENMVVAPTDVTETEGVLATMKEKNLIPE